MRLIKWLIEFFKMQHVPPIPTVVCKEVVNGDEDAPEWLEHNKDKK